jgi:hypothetical protein
MTMNAIVVRSPRTLSKPRRVEIVKSTSAVGTVLQGAATAIVRGFKGGATLATRARDLAAPPREARWVNARQIDAPSQYHPVAPALPPEPRQVKVQNFLDMFD